MYSGIFQQYEVMFMCCNCKKEQEQMMNAQGVDLGLVAPIAEKYKGTNGSLITILQETQEIYGYLPTEVLSELSKLTGIKASKIYGVATFYTQFRLKPIGKYLIMLCQGTACFVNGSSAIEKTICETLGINEGETTEDGLFTFNNVACLGCCSLAPVMMINDETYANLSPDKTREILNGILAKEQEVTA